MEKLKTSLYKNFISSPFSNIKFRLYIYFKSPMKRNILDSNVKIEICILN